MAQQQYYYGTGKRKTSIARVRLYKDSGSPIVNSKPLEEVFPWLSWQAAISEPFQVTNTAGEYRVVAESRTHGGLSIGDETNRVLVVRVPGIARQGLTSQTQATCQWCRAAER